MSLAVYECWKRRGCLWLEKEMAADFFAIRPAVERYHFGGDGFSNWPPLLLLGWQRASCDRIASLGGALQCHQRCRELPIFGIEYGGQYRSCLRLAAASVTKMRPVAMGGGQLNVHTMYCIYTFIHLRPSVLSAICVISVSPLVNRFGLSVMTLPDSKTLFFYLEPSLALSYVRLPSSVRTGYFSWLNWCFRPLYSAVNVNPVPPWSGGRH
jgi:hypothetical protein